MPSNDTKPTTDQNKSSGGDKKSDSGAKQTQNAVGHYILGKALGEGTFGKVKLGTHILSGEKVAVKVLEKSRIKDKKDVERISREIKILKQLHHPNVVQIYEIIETEKDLYLVMEYASGGELFDLIVQNQRLKEKSASKYFQELVAGVHYIHKLGICHRDLKPENLLIDYDKSLKIVDFGLSNTYEKGQTLKTACGSPCYAAPEMIAGNRYHGLKSDLWSCGVVLYAMLCGYLPFEDQKTSNLYKKILNADYSLPKFLSSDAKDFLGRLFETNPDKRIDIDGIRAHPWYKLNQPEPQVFNYHGQKVRISSKIVQKLEGQLGFNKDSVERSVTNNKHNHLSATYFLIYKKYACQAYKQAAAGPQPTSKSTTIVKQDSQTTDRPQKKRSTSSHQPTASSTNPAVSSKARTDYRSSTDQAGSPPSQEEKKKEDRSASKNPKPSAPPTSSFNQTQPIPSTSHYNPHKANDEFMGRSEIRQAPVQDQLVLKNHRREQSANATASRPNKHSNTWGEDERRTESYHRPSHAEDYEVVMSKPTTATSKPAPAPVPPLTTSLDNRKQSLSQTQPQAPRSSSSGPPTATAKRDGGSTPVQGASQASVSAATPAGSGNYQQRRKSNSNHQPTSQQQNRDQQQPQISSKLRSSSAHQKQPDKKQSTHIQTSVNPDKKHHSNHAGTTSSKEKQRQTKSVASPDDLNKYFYSSNGAKAAQKAVRDNTTNPEQRQEAVTFKNQQPQQQTNQQQQQVKPDTNMNKQPVPQQTNNFMLMSDLQHMLSQKSYFDSIVSSSNNRDKEQIMAAAAPNASTEKHTTVQTLNSAQQPPRATSVNTNGQPPAAMMTSLHDTISTQHSKNVGNYGQLSHAPQSRAKDSSVIMIKDGQYHSYNRESSNSRTGNSTKNQTHQNQKIPKDKTIKTSQRTNNGGHEDHFTVRSLDYASEDLQRFKQPVTSSQHAQPPLQLQSEAKVNIQSVSASSPSSMIPPHQKAVFYGTIPISSTSASHPTQTLQPKAPTHQFNMTQQTASTKQSSQVKHGSSNKLNKTQQYVPTTTKLSSSQAHQKSASKTTQRTQQKTHSNSQQNSRGRSADNRQQTQTVQQANLMHHQLATSQLSHLQYHYGSGHRSHSTTASMQPGQGQNPVSQSQQFQNKSQSISHAATIYAQQAAGGTTNGGQKSTSKRVDPAKDSGVRRRAQSLSYQSGTTQPSKSNSQQQESRQRNNSNRSQQHHRSSHNGSSSQNQPSASALMHQQQQSQIEREHTKQLLMRSLDLTLQHQQAHVQASGKRTTQNIKTTSSRTKQQAQHHSQAVPPQSMSEQDINRFYKQLVMQQKPEDRLAETQQISSKLIKQSNTTKVHGNRYAGQQNTAPSQGNYMMSVPGTYYQQSRKERDDQMTQYLLNQTLNAQNQPTANRAQQVVAASNKIISGQASAFARKVDQQQQSIGQQKGQSLTLNTNFFHPNSNSLSSTDRLMGHSTEKIQMSQQYNVHPNRPGAGKAVAATDLGIDMKSVLLGNVVSNSGKPAGKQQFSQSQGHDQLEYFNKVHQQMQSQQPHDRGYGVVPQANYNATSHAAGKQQQPQQQQQHYQQMDVKNISPTSLVTTQKQQAQQQYAQQQQQYFSGPIQGENRLSFTRFCQ